MKQTSFSRAWVKKHIGITDIIIDKWVEEERLFVSYSPEGTGRYFTRECIEAMPGGYELIERWELKQRKNRR